MLILVSDESAWGLAKLMCPGHNGVLRGVLRDMPPTQNRTRTHTHLNSCCVSGRPNSLGRLTNASHFSQLQWTTYFRVPFSEGTHVSRRIALETPITHPPLACECVCVKRWTDCHFLTMIEELNVVAVWAGSVNFLANDFSQYEY